MFLNYLRGEMYRILHKKSMYIYFGCFAAAYALIIFLVRGGDAINETILVDAENLFSFLPAIIGGYLFAAIYTDDLSNKNLAALVGFGMGKARIALSKLILTVMLGGVIFGLLPLFMSGAYAIMGVAPTAAILGDVYIYALYTFMKLFICTTVSSIVVYGLQRTTFGMVTYMLLSLGIISQLLSLLLSWDVIANVIPGIHDHTMFGICDRFMIGMLSPGGNVFMPVIEYIIYATVATVLTVFVFNKKELEF